MRVVHTPLKILKIAFDYIKLSQDDILVDLGSGDGRVCFYASKKYRCKAIGYEIDKELYNKGVATNKWARRNVEFYNKDLRKADLSKATVIYCYPYNSGPYPNMLKQVTETIKEINTRMIFLDLVPCNVKVSSVLKIDKSILYFHESDG